MRKQAVLTAPPAWVNSRHGLTKGKAIRLEEESEVSEWKETAAIWLYIGGMIIFAAAL
jgi:hypothetical protein|nr:MAG TPA: hypothetical protein [Caudoviricetes sp.]